MDPSLRNAHLISATAGAHLLQFAGFSEPIWCGGCEERASERLTALLGLAGEPPRLRFDKNPGRDPRRRKRDLRATLLVETQPAAGMTGSDIAGLIA